MQRSSYLVVLVFKNDLLGLGCLDGIVHGLVKPILVETVCLMVQNHRLGVEQVLHEVSLSEELHSIPPLDKVLVVRELGTVIGVLLDGHLQVSDGPWFHMYVPRLDGSVGVVGRGPEPVEGTLA